jgi:hypothetical protein
MGVPEWIGTPGAELELEVAVRATSMTGHVVARAKGRRTLVLP